MNFITCIFLVIVAFFFWRGYQKGFAASFAQILSLAIAYPAAIVFTNPVANFIFSHTSFTGMLVYFIAGSAIFLVVGLLVTSLIKGIARLFPHSEFNTNSSKVGGALIGALIGGTVGLIAVYAINLTQKLPVEKSPVEEQVSNDVRATPSAGPYTINRDSFIESSAKKFISTAASTAVEFALEDKTATHITKAFTQNPQKILGHIQNLSNEGELKTLMSDPEIQVLLNKGDTQALLNNWKFQQLMNNEDMQAILVTSEDTQNGKISQEVAAEKLVAAWQRSHAIKNDPRVVAIVTDPEFQQQLNSPNKLALMMNPKLKQLTDIIFSNDYQAADGLANYQIEDVTHKQDLIHNRAEDAEEAQHLDGPKNSEKTKIYRWTDSSGKVHYSDEARKK